MRLKCIACEVVARPIYLRAAHSPHIIDVTLVRYALHTTPQKLRKTLQDHILAADQAGGYDAVVLAYGLCGKAIDGLQAGKLPLILPRAHDCITLFLGSRDRYQQAFDDCPGTYWYVQDYIERGDPDNISLSIGANTSQDKDALFEDYVKKYGEDNASYLIDTMSLWQEHYERAAYIDMGIGSSHQAIRKAQTDAEENGWRFESFEGSLILIKKLLDGQWDEDFLQLAPGEKIKMVGGRDIIQAV